MTDRVVLKRLTASDLTFFEPLYRKLDAGNQKAINLNADVFIERLYPTLPALISTLGDVIPVTLTILGPDGAGPHVISRAVTKREAYKNWRLNGEFVRDPEGEAGRFDLLQVDDLAVMDFTGDTAPQRVKLLLVTAASPIDASLHTALKSLVPGGRRTMAQISRAEIASAAASTRPSHPVWSIATDPDFEAAIEDAAEGGIKGTEALQTKTTKVVTSAMLAAAKAAAEKNGRDGEALAWIHLQDIKAAGGWAKIDWSSKTNAVSPFDFQATDLAGSVVRIDAKSTSGEFGRMIHMSMAELTEAAKGGRYDIWRVYGITDDGAKLRITEDIGAIAKTIIDGLSLPSGISIDSVSIDPSGFTWSPEIEIVRPETPSSE